MKKSKILGLKTSLKIAKKSINKQTKRGDKLVEVHVSWVQVSPKGETKSKSYKLKFNKSLLNKWTTPIVVPDYQQIGVLRLEVVIC